uniref:Glycosyltransferase subfamily 4-like N-terminal domain-containing protein n=1 Tax=Florenciella parvula TaxID=236787 RepID=A0A7S2CA78_9STRA
MAPLSMVKRSATRMSAGPPALNSQPPQRVGLMVEPTPFTHVSGYANRFNEMLRYMRKAGDEVEVVTPDESEVAPKKKFGFRINTIEGFQFPLYKQICLSFDWKMRAYSAMKRFKPELIHVSTPSMLVFNCLMYTNRHKIPLVMSYHTHFPVYAKKYMGWIPGIEHAAWLLLRLVHNRADLTLVTSPQMQQELQENGVKRVEVWRKGIDTIRFSPEFRSEDFRSTLTDGNPNDPLMVYVGRLGAEKRIADIRAVMDQCPNVRLAIVGGGPEEEELRRVFAGTKTVFTGQLQGDDLSKAFAAADMFMMPSDSETLGFVVLESMASGVPVIGCNRGGVMGLIDHGKTGYLVEPGDTAGYVARVKELLANPALRQQLGKNAREEAERWDWEAATSQLRNVQYGLALKNFNIRAREKALSFRERCEKVAEPYMQKFVHCW